VLTRGFERCITVSDLGDHAHVGRTVNDQRQSVPHHCVVVRDQHPDPGHDLPGSGLSLEIRITRQTCDVVRDERIGFRTRDIARLLHLASEGGDQALGIVLHVVQHFGDGVSMDQIAHFVPVFREPNVHRIGITE
jgi:hypothetical protein